MEIHEFDSMEDMIAFQQTLHEQASAAVLPTQKAMQPGDFWMRPVDEMGIIIFGRWHTPEEVYDAERAAGAPEAEARMVQQHEAARGADGYLFGTAYSPVEPEGELGSTHASLVWPISEGEFLNAKENGWELGVPNPKDEDNPLVAWWVVAMCERVGNAVVEDVLEANVTPYFNLRTILLILNHPEWHEPAPRSKFTEDMVLEEVDPDAR